MKAAVLHQFGSVPVYDDFPSPVAGNEQEIVMNVKAASVKNLDRSRASGAHYASYTHLPAIVGFDCVGTLEDGSRVYALGVSGTIAEQALVRKSSCVPLPPELDYVTAAALPNAVMGAAMALNNRGGIKKGDTVLINGATGITGRIAVQIAKHYGAARIIGTGRNEESLQKLLELGATDVISLNQEDDCIIKTLKELHAQKPINLVIDYLWGHPVELVLQALKGGGLTGLTPKVRIVTVGSMAGEQIQLASGALRSSAIELLGSGLGSLSQQDIYQLTTDILPAMFRMAARGQLTIETETAPLKDIAIAWEKDATPGKRLVICI